MNSSTHNTDQADDSRLLSVAATIDEERLIEQAAEQTPLPNDALPEDLAEVRTEGFSLREKFLNFKSLLSFGLAFGLIALIFWKTDIDLATMWHQMKQLEPWRYVTAFVLFYALFPKLNFRTRVNFLKER